MLWKGFNVSLGAHLSSVVEKKTEGDLGTGNSPGPHRDSPSLVKAAF